MAFFDFEIFLMWKSMSKLSSPNDAGVCQANQRDDDKPTNHGSNIWWDNCTNLHAMQLNGELHIAFLLV